MAYGIRQYLKDNGYGDNDITYNDGTVYLKGKSFMQATPDSTGTTYASQGAIANALKSYRNNENQAQQTTLMNQASQQLQQPSRTFSYDPQSDPQYQTALQAALKSAQKTSTDTLARLRANGQGKSSWSEGVAQSAMQNAQENVNSSILPQLISQAYTRHRDEIGDNRANALDKAGLASQFGSSVQQALQNQRYDENVDYQKQQDTIRNDAAYAGTYNPYTPQIAQMRQNSDAWFNASPEEQQRLAVDNQSLGAQIGATRDENGNWVYPADQQTVAQQQQAFNNDITRKGSDIAESSVTGTYNGQPTYQAKKDAQARDDDAKQLAARMGLEWAKMNQNDQQFLAEMAYKYSTRDWERDPNNPANQLNNENKQSIIDSRNASQFQNITGQIDSSRFLTKQYDDNGKTTGFAVSDPQGLEKYILSMNLPDDQARQLYMRYGLNWGN